MDAGDFIVFIGDFVVGTLFKVVILVGVDLVMICFFSDGEDGAEEDGLILFSDVSDDVLFLIDCFS